MGGEGGVQGLDRKIKTFSLEIMKKYIFFIKIYSYVRGQPCVDGVSLLLPLRLGLGEVGDAGAEAAVVGVIWEKIIN